VVTKYPRRFWISFNDRNKGSRLLFESIMIKPLIISLASGVMPDQPPRIANSPKREPPARLHGVTRMAPATHAPVITNRIPRTNSQLPFLRRLLHPLCVCHPGAFGGGAAHGCAPSRTPAGSVVWGRRGVGRRGSLFRFRRGSWSTLEYFDSAGKFVALCDQ
jgi:hypothetical protein